MNLRSRGAVRDRRCHRKNVFNAMPVPKDVTVTRQVLADPDSQLNDRTWATLMDGTPLVTAQRRGKGVLVLFHVTADTRWSDLPLSGSFVDMLRRLGPAMRDRIRDRVILPSNQGLIRRHHRQFLNRYSHRHRNKT